MISEDIQKVLDTYMTGFLSQVSTEFQLPKDVLLSKWNGYRTPTTLPSAPPSTPSSSPVSKKNTCVSGTNPPKKSAYQYYLAKRRSEMSKIQPTITFGELSSLVSSEWKKFTAEEKAVYAPPTSPLPCPPSGTSQTVSLPVTLSSNVSLSETPNYTFSSLNSMKMNDLKDICETLGVTRKGNKKELINSILHKETATLSKTVNPSAPKITELIQKDTSLDLYVSSNNEKRSDYENLETVEEDEDFIFEDEDNGSQKFEDSDSEGTIDDDDEDDAFH